MSIGLDDIFAVWSPADFFRILLQDIFPNEKKFLYLDADTLIYKDLTKLYNYNITDKYYIGMLEFKVFSYARYFKKRFNNYINTGVLLCNLEELRKGNISEKFIQFHKEYNKQIRYPVNDPLNIVSHEKNGYFDPEYVVIGFCDENAAAEYYTKTAIKLKGIDGLICKNNTFFFAGYSAQDQIKEYNIDLDHCTFTIIEGNNLFESGYDGIRLNKFQNTIVKGNHFAWSSQRQPGSCLNLIGNTASDVSNSIIEGNTFNSPSLYGINVNCFIRGLTISNNSFIFDSSNQYYYGSETIPLNSRKTIHVPSDYSGSNILITNNNYYNWEDDISYGSQNTTIKSINNLSKYGVINNGNSFINITDDAWGTTNLNLPSNEAFIKDRVYIPDSRTIGLNIQCIGTPIENRVIQIFNLSDVTVYLSQTDYTKTQIGASVQIPKFGTVTIIAHDGMWLQVA